MPSQPLKQSFDVGIISFWRLKYLRLRDVKRLARVTQLSEPCNQDMPPLSLKELTRKSKELKCDSKGHVQFNFYDLQKPRLKKPATFFQQGLTIQENE